MVRLTSYGATKELLPTFGTIFGIACLESKEVSVGKWHPSSVLACLPVRR